jgi:Transcriptional regulator, AbiEi antitoxin, Type IV TA system
MVKWYFQVKTSERELVSRVEKVLSSCLAKVPFLKIKDVIQEPGQEDVRPDFLISLEVPEGAQTLIVEVKNTGQPRVARDAVNQLLRFSQEFPQAFPVFIAPYISPKAAEICELAGVGYIDFSGNCRLSFQEIYIEKTGNPNVFSEKRDLRSLYSPKAENILRVLLTPPIKTWKIQELADEAGVSVGQVAKVKNLLLNREWLREADGMVMSEPLRLLNEWAQNYNFRKNRVKDFYSMKSISEIEFGLANLCKGEKLTYALTSFSGAARLAPAVRYQRVFAYVEDTDKDVAGLLNVKEVPSGANVSLLTPYDEGIFYGSKEMNGVSIASPIQIYLDLKTYRGRGEEAADMLLEQVIRKKWQQ